MAVNITPVYLTAVVKSLEMHHETLNEAGPGDNVGFSVKGVDYRDIQRGFVCSDANNDPAQEVASFIAQIVVFNYPNQICQGFTPVIDCHTAHVACQFVELISKVCRRTGKVIEDAPKCLKAGESGIVKLVPTKPICVEKFSDYPALGRFAIRDMAQNIGVGIVIDVEKRATLPNRGTAGKNKR
ncbi:unnamed protein product [Adineta ricciae]|uniref:Elongation factor 1-alpha n=1 Tax=Adineta ricciae TaxID=249248 RepID=A0A815G5L5_ADIRI|nr:unnamed protein product [Adineta ricciae]CAF1334324.1 unnamed protein product [Adineta ricciae]